MNTQMQTLSARVSADDVAWLASLEIAGASTPSDKLRALIAQMRRQHEGSLDYTACVAWVRELLTPVIAQLRETEHRRHIHSAALSVIAEWVPQIVATLLAARSPAKDAEGAAIELETALVQQSFQLLAALLRLGITPNAECYTADVIEKQLPRVMELAQVITANRESKETSK